jgi:hypothetical protein
MSLGLGLHRRPCGQKVIDGEPMASPKLKDLPAPGQMIKSDVRLFSTLHTVTHTCC